MIEFLASDGYGYERAMRLDDTQSGTFLKGYRSGAGVAQVSGISAAYEVRPSRRSGELGPEGQVAQLLQPEVQRERILTSNLQLSAMRTAVCPGDPRTSRPSYPL